MQDEQSPTSSEETPVAPVDEAADLESSPEELDDAPTLFSWQASEYIHHSKKAGWYVLLAIAVAVMLGLGIWTKQWTFIALLVAMTAAVLVYGNKQPRVLNYVLNDGGISIEHKFYPYDHFRSFGVVTDLGWHTIDLDPNQRFMPRLSILFDDNDLDTIIEALSDKLPRHDRQPDPIERLTRYLKF